MLLRLTFKISSVLPVITVQKQAILHRHLFKEETLVVLLMYSCFISVCMSLAVDFNSGG